MDEIEKLRADLVLAGWRIERNILNDQMNLVDWYAWQPKRPADWPNCQCNDKPPSVCIYPYAVNLPQQEKTFANVEVEVCGELAGRWYKLRSYSITAGEAMDALPHITASLGAAWKAIAEMDAPAAQGEPSDPLQGAANWLLEAINGCNISTLQSHLKIGFNRAERLMLAAMQRTSDGGAA